MFRGVSFGVENNVHYCVVPLVPYPSAMPRCRSLQTEHGEGEVAERERSREEGTCRHFNKAHCFHDSQEIIVKCSWTRLTDCSSSAFTIAVRAAESFGESFFFFTVFVAMASPNARSRLGHGQHGMAL